MKNTKYHAFLQYNGFKAIIESKGEDGLLTGYILNAAEQLWFNAPDFDSVMDSFKDCVDCYVEYCKSHNVNPIIKPKSPMEILAEYATKNKDVPYSTDTGKVVSAINDLFSNYIIQEKGEFKDTHADYWNNLGNISKPKSVQIVEKINIRCENCKKDYGEIIIKLKDNMGEQSFCPNCLALMVCNQDLYLENDMSLKDDVTGKWGAIEFLSGDEHYVLEKERMIRLICKNLRKEEYLVLSQKYGADKYELHDDFYLEDGTAIQPMKI